MMFRKLGSSVVLLLSLLASSALADPDARIRWDVDVKVRQLSDRVVCKFDPANEPVPFNINGTIMDLNPQAYENRVLVTSDLVQVVAFYQEANYVYNHYQGYAGKDLITYLPIPFNGSYNFKMWNNDPDVSIFNYKSALENGNATSTLPLMVYIRPLVSRMMKREPAASLPFTIDRANLPDSIVPFERNQLDVDISNEIAKRISEYEATYGHRRLSKEFSAELAGWLSPLVGRENVPIIAECSRFVSSNASSLDPVHSSEAYFTQTSVYDAETGKIFVYDEVSDKIGVGSDLNQPQGMPLISHARCVPMKWCPCTVLNGCLPFCNGSLPFCNGTITLAKPKLTMMKLCRCQHRTLLALAFDDGRIFMYDPFLCGVVNIIERRCRCTRYLVYPVWMEWCCRTNRLIVQYEKRTRLVVDEEEAIEIHGREAHMTTQQILNELANQFAEDVDHDLSEALNRVRARPNKHFINVYKFDELVRLASEPALEYTIRACNIKFVRYCCCSGHLFVVHQQNLHMAIVVFDRNMRIVARKIVLDPIEKFEVTCCPPKSEQYAGCACVVYMVTSPRLPNMEPVDPENPYRLNVLCVRKVLDIQLLAEYAGDLEICSEFIDVQAHAAAEFIIDLELPLLLSDS